MAWIAMFAILCHALMPTIAQARATLAPQFLIDLCTVSGIKQIALEDGKSMPSTGKNLLGQHCPFCLSGSHFALPPAPTLAVFRADIHSAVFVPAVSTPRVKSRKHAAAPPRGPPSFS